MRAANEDGKNVLHVALQPPGAGLSLTKRQWILEVQQQRQRAYSSGFLRSNRRAALSAGCRRFDASPKRKSVDGWFSFRFQTTEVAYATTPDEGYRLA